MKYIILTSSDASDLSRQVMEHLAEGWELAGGVSASVSESETYIYGTFAQALTNTTSGEEPS